MKIASFLLGLFVTIEGVQIAFYCKKTISKGFVIPPIGGIGMIGIGVIFILISISDKENNFLPADEPLDKCPGCGKLYKANDQLSDRICPECDGEIEKLDGFYERHPEFKNEVNETFFQDKE